LQKFSTEFEKFSEIGGKSETGGNAKCIIASGGMDAPGYHISPKSSMTLLTFIIRNVIILQLST